MGEDSASDVDVDIVDLEEASVQAPDEVPQGNSSPTEAGTEGAEHEAPGQTDAPAQETEDAAEIAQEGEAAQGAEQTVKRGRGRPKKNFTTPVLPKGPKRGPGRPRNSELLARFANSHRPSGAPQLLPDLAPKPASAGRKRGRGRARISDSPRTPAVKRPPVERVSRLRVASGPSTRGGGSSGRSRGRGRRSRSARRGSDDDDEDDDDIDDLLESDEGDSGPENLSDAEPADAPASQVSDPFPSDGGPSLQLPAYFTVLYCTQLCLLVM